MEALLLDHAAHPHQVERALNLVVVVRLAPRRQPAEADATVAPVRVANVANGLPYLHHHLVPLGRQARAFGRSTGLFEERAFRLKSPFESHPLS